MAFTVKNLLHNRATALLHLETMPGLGCTEPAAVGLCAAGAASLLDTDDFQSIELVVNPNIFKNAMRVIIPSSGGEAGLDLAAAMGALARTPHLKLQIFSAVDQHLLEKARLLVSEGKVSLHINKDHKGLYIETKIRTKDHTAIAVISNKHDHFESLTLDGETQDSPFMAEYPVDQEDLSTLESWLTSLSLRELLDLLEQLDDDDLTYIEQGIIMNQKLAEYGLAEGPGLGVGKASLGLIQKGLIKKDMAHWAGVLTSAGIDSRMGGVMLPAMTLAGSGNQGIAASIPILAVKEYAVVEDIQVFLKAVTLSYLITCYLKSLVGTLGALCGSGVAAGAGVAAGVTYLLGGDEENIGGAIKNHLENFSTVVCDGAKTSCALKVGEAVSSAVKSALLALEGIVVKPHDGFIALSPEESMKNLGKLTNEGLATMDQTLLKIMRGNLL